MIGDSLGLVVLLIFCVVLAYLAAHFFVDRLQQRFLVMSGAEYFLLGVLLGPVIPQIGALRDLSGLMPIIALAAGWIGLLRGMEFDVRRLLQADGGTMRVASLHSALVGGGVAAAAWFFFQRLGAPYETREGALCAGVLGCCAAVGSATSVELLARKYRLGHTVPQLLRQSSRLIELFAIAVFGGLVCVFHEDAAGATLDLTPTEWVVLCAAIGLTLGTLFTPFLGEEDSPNHRFLALAGVITFASGSAYVLHVSPLLVNLFLGIALVNVASSGKQIRQTLESTERPMSLVLLILAGALWRIPDLTTTLLILLGFVIIRIFAGFIAGRAIALGGLYRSDLFRGLLGHGEVPVAIAVSMRLVYEGPVVDVCYSVVVASVILHHLIGPRSARSLLVDAGDLNKESDVGTRASLSPESVLS